MLSENYPSFSNLWNEKDIENIAQCMSLDLEQRDCLDQLRLGHAIVKMKGRYLEPFLLKFPLFSIQRGKTADFQIREQMKDYLRKLKMNPSINKKRSSVRRVSLPDVLPFVEKAMLVSIANRPFLGTVKRYTELGLNRYEGNKIKDSLNRINMIKPVTVNRKKLYELTERGLDYLHSEGIYIKLNPKEGGLEHRYWIHQVCRKLKNEGWNVEREKNSKTMAIEVETGKSNKRKDQYFDSIELESYDSMWIIYINAHDCIKEKEKFLTIGKRSQ